MANNNYVFKDNTELVLNALHSATKEGAQKMADCAVDSVQYQILYGYKDPHGKDGHTEIVDTGALFDSIKGDVKRQSQNLYTITVGTDRKYAVYVHNGTRYLKARRFITDGINRARGDMEDILRDEMKNA
jgi:HK97 gp10 family phage protein